MLAIVESEELDEITLVNGEYERWYKPVPVKKRLERWVMVEQNIVEVTVENNGDICLETGKAP